jgi:hypothetical protein
MYIIYNAGGISATTMAGDIKFFSLAGPVGDYTEAHTAIFRGVFSIHYSPGSEAAMGWAEVGGHNMICMTIRELHCTFADFL